MPQLLVPIISAIGAGVGGVVGAGLIMYAGAIATGVLLLGSLAISQSQKRKAERQARAQFDASQVDRLANIPTTVASRELVLGKVRKGGHVFFRGTSNPFKSTFAMCIAVAAHEIDAYEQFYFNDQPVSVDGSGNVTTAPYGRYRRVSAGDTIPATTTLSGVPLQDGRPPVLIRTNSAGLKESVAYSLSGANITIPDFDGSASYLFSYEYNVFDSFANVRGYTGTTGQTADARLQALFPGVWTASHRVAGVAYIICEFQYDETAFPSGIPNVTALVRGAKMYDPRTTLTTHSSNPALMIRHVLMHPQFGKRSSISAAEDVRIIAAANACDTAIAYDGVNAVATYRAATVIPFGATAREVLDDLSQAMGGQWAYASGEIFMRAGVYQAAVLHLFDNDLAVVQRGNDGSVNQNPITISTHRARNDKLNSVVPRIWAEDAGYVMTPISPFTVDAYVTADGAQLVQEVTMPAVFHRYQAWHIAGIMLRDARDPLTVTLPFKLRAYPVELFDTVTVTLSRYGWSSKEFQVLGRSFSPEGYVQLTLKETAAAIYQWNGGFSAQGYADNTTLPDPWNIQPPSISSVTSSESDLIVQSDGTIINGIRVTWAAIQDATVTGNGSVEVQYRVLPGGGWQSVSVHGGLTQATIAGVPDNSWVVVRARARNAVAVSEWGAQWTVQASGKTAPPPNITGLSIAGSVLSWTLANPPRDLAGYVFRFHYGNNLDWNSAAPLHSGILTESPYDLVSRPAGTVTIMGKAIDTTRNVSVNSANIVMNLGNPTIANILEQWNFDALSWPYDTAESSGWTIVAGDPSANALDSFYGTDDQSFYGVATASFYGPSAYGKLVYTTTEISVISALAGSVMTVVATTQGIDLRIDYRLSGPGSFYGPDGESFYGADAAPFYDAPGAWNPWPGQIVTSRDGYQFRVTIGADPVRGIVQGLLVTIDAPDMEESLSDISINSGGTTIPYTKAFTAIKTVQATLQANGSGAETVEINKTSPLAPSIKAYNSSHTAVSGSTADIVLRGY